MPPLHRLCLGFVPGHRAIPAMGQAAKTSLRAPGAGKPTGAFPDGEKTAGGQK